MTHLARSSTAAPDGHPAAPSLLADCLEEIGRLEGLNPERRHEAFRSLGGDRRQRIVSYFALNKERRPDLIRSALSIRGHA